MSIMINESGTIKKIGDNLHPGSVFLLDLMGDTLSELGFTSSHYVSGSGYANLKYVNSFDIGFKATFALIFTLKGSAVNAKTFISDKLNMIESFSGTTSSSYGLLGANPIEICLQGNSRPTTTSTPNYCITVSAARNSTTPHAYMSAETNRVDARLAFELQGSKLDLYGQIAALSNFTWDDYKNTYFYHRQNTGAVNSPMFMVIAI